MKDNTIQEIFTASSAANFEEQEVVKIEFDEISEDIQSLISNSTENYKSIEDEIRVDLTYSLGNLGKAVQNLIILLERNNIVHMLPEVALADYSEILDSISTSAIQASEAVVKSQEFDNKVNLALDICQTIQ